MRRHLLAVFLIVTLFIAAVPMASAEDGSHDAATKLTVTGKISHGSEPQATVNPVKITIYVLEDGELKDIDAKWNKPLEEEGAFSIEVKEFESSKRYFMTISETGFVVYSCPESMEKSDDFPAFELKHEGRIKDNEFPLTSTGHYIVMGGSHGVITGKIQSSSGSKPFLNGVKVTLTSLETNVKITTYTSGGGEYTFDVDTGEYTLTAETKGFKDYEYSDKVIVDPGITKTITSIEMDPTNDISTAHYMTIGGFVCALALLGCVIFFVIRHRNA